MRTLSHQLAYLLDASEGKKLPGTKVLDLRHPSNELVMENIMDTQYVIIADMSLPEGWLRYRLEIL